VTEGGEGGGGKGAPSEKDHNYEWSGSAWGVWGVVLIVKAFDVCLETRACARTHTHTYTHTHTHTHRLCRQN